LFRFSMIRLIRTSSHKLDRELRNKIADLYRPFRWVPCFLHKWAESLIKRVKKYPVIIEFENGEDAYQKGMQDVHTCVNRHFRCGMKFEHQTIFCCSATLSAKALEHLLTHSSHIKRVYLDREVKALLDTAVPTIHADLLHKSGYTGKGVTIAIIDTGIALHQDLVRPTNRIVAFKDFIQNRTSPYDDNGHGTHCAGDAAGNGYLSNGKYRGPAYEANVVGVKVLDSEGSGSLSTVIAGVEWCIANKTRYNIKILSLSLGSPATQSYTTDPLVKAVEAAWKQGMVVCAAAGNEGPYARTISTPGISPQVITVGAISDRNTTIRTDDEMADFSSRGPTIDGLVKPDLVCPGVNIVSLRSPNSYLDRTQKSSRVGQHYFIMSGTSMATPICAGVVAQLLQKSPVLTPNQVKYLLLNSAVDLGLPPHTQGKGCLDVEKLL